MGTSTMAQSGLHTLGRPVGPSHLSFGSSQQRCVTIVAYCWNWAMVLQRALTARSIIVQVAGALVVLAPVYAGRHEHTYTLDVYGRCGVQWAPAPQERPPQGLLEGGGGGGPLPVPPGVGDPHESATRIRSELWPQPVFAVQPPAISAAVHIRAPSAAQMARDSA